MGGLAEGYRGQGVRATGGGLRGAETKGDRGDWRSAPWPPGAAVVTMGRAMCGGPGRGWTGVGCGEWGVGCGEGLSVVKSE